MHALFSSAFCVDKKPGSVRQIGKLQQFPLAPRGKLEKCRVQIRRISVCAHDMKCLQGWLATTSRKEPIVPAGTMFFKAVAGGPWRHSIEMLMFCTECPEGCETQCFWSWRPSLLYMRGDNCSSVLFREKSRLQNWHECNKQLNPVALYIMRNNLFC